MTLAWYIAKLSRAKSIPSINKLLIRSSRERVRQTEAQMLNVARMLAGVSFPEKNPKG